MFLRQRHIRDPNHSSLLQTLRAGIVVSALLACVACAEHQPRSLVMTVYSDGAGGKSVARGRYSAAIAEINLHKRTLDLYPSINSTNLCVAYSMTQQWTAAQRACNAAVSEARAEQASMPSWSDGTPARRNEHIAAAYANRAVLHWLSQDTDGAASDLAMAKEFASKADFVARNVAVLSAKDTAGTQDNVSPQG
jgi:hypothetical protein